jgi:hypothetical protein
MKYKILRNISKMDHIGEKHPGLQAQVVVGVMGSLLEEQKHQQ